MSDQNLVNELKRLAQLDVDAIGAYTAAIERIDESKKRDELSGFRVDHVRHVQDLNALIVAAGGEAVDQEPGLKGVVLKGLTSITSVMGTEAALLAMIGNEELTTHTYESALKLPWTSEQRTVVEKNYADEQRHLAWLKKAATTRG